MPETFIRFLRKDFSTWLKDRIDQYGFAENSDYVSIPQNGGKPSGGRPSKEYALSLDMAKELAMVERNEKGKQARQYFIECERMAKNNVANIYETLKDPTQMRGYLLHYVEKVLALEAENQSMKGDVMALDRLAKAENSLCMTDAAKALGLTRNRLTKYLSMNDWIYKRHGGGNWLGYSDKEKRGLVEHKLSEYSSKDGSIKISEQVRITPKGMVRLAKLLAEGDVA